MTDTDKMFDELQRRKVARHMNRYRPHFVLAGNLLMCAAVLAYRGMSWWALACLVGAGLVFAYVMTQKVQW
jgi:Flp pilus assembly protein TadB